MANQYRSPTETTAPVEGTSAGLYTFGTKTGVVLVSNTTGQIAYLRFNTSTAASVTAFDILVPNGTSLRLNKWEFGVDAFDLVGVWLPSSAVEEQLIIRGM